MGSSIILALCVGLISSVYIGSPPPPLPSFIGPILASQPLPSQGPQCNCNPASTQNSAYPQRRPPPAIPDNEYVLRFKYAARTLWISPSDPMSGGLFYWNGKLIANITTYDGRIQNASYKVRGRDGVNQLRIKVEGAPGCFGFQFDDVTLTKKGGNHNYIVNGDFQDGQAPNGGQWGPYVKSGWIPNGYTAVGIGKGSIYNPNWTSQACELQKWNNSYSDFSQKIKLRVPSDRRNAAPRRADKPYAQGERDSCESESISAVSDQ